MSVSRKRVFRCVKGSLQHQFLSSRKKIRLFGGGFGNGKTTAACIGAIQVGQDYPGANILLARSTYPKLEQTLKKEFLKWLPASLIQSRSEKHGTLTLKNGTVYNFRYVAQQGKSNEDGSATSNLLSATYDLVVVDQAEDPEIQSKDFYDLLGRLRGSTRYDPVGDIDDTMPATGPRWMFLTTNPTRNWVYTKLVRPIHTFRATGIVSDDLIYDTDENGKITPSIDLIEGSTYTNKENLPADFIEQLEKTYKGQMRDRFLMGEWAAYEGLIYHMFNAVDHVLHEDWVKQYIRHLIRNGVRIKWLEGYDHGIAVPSCYMLAIVDLEGNIIVIDGFYEAGMTVESSANQIKRIRSNWGAPGENFIQADPALFKRTTGSINRVGTTVAGLFQECGIRMEPGNNEKMNGIIKVSSYLSPIVSRPHIENPLRAGSYLYLSTKVDFCINEIENYFWKTDMQTGHRVDVPTDKNDHAMDTLRYMLTDRPTIAQLADPHSVSRPAYLDWHEIENDNRKQSKAHRYG